METLLIGREPSTESASTLFEVLRESLSLPADDVIWIHSGTKRPRPVTSHGSSGEHPWGPSLILPDLVLLGGLPKLLREEDLLKTLPPLPESLRATESPKTEGASIQPKTAAALASGLLSEIGQKQRGDAAALRLARHLLAASAPRLLAVTLGDAHVASTDFDAYLQVLKRNDELIGSLWDEIQGHEHLRNSTSLWIVPVIGRSKRHTSPGPLELPADPRERTSVFAVAEGPGVKSKTRLRSAMNLEDIAPTLCHLLGARTSPFKGRVLKSGLT